MKKISIEDLLSWAFLEELPKLGSPNARDKPTYSYLPSGSDVLEEVSEYGTLIDKDTNVYGVVPSGVFQGDPHPDAVKAGDAVRALRHVDGMDIGEGWQPFRDWPDEYGLVAAEVERVRRQEIGRRRADHRSIVMLVTNAAILRRGPDWHAEKPREIMVTRYGNPSWFVRRSVEHSDGVIRIVEDEGFDSRKRRPKKGAYNKFRLEHSIEAAILDRMEWQVWQSALQSLAETLAGRLTAHEIRPFVPDWQPWLSRVKAASA